MTADDSGVSPGMDSGDVAPELVALTERQHELWAQLSNEPDEKHRSALFDQLNENRLELARLTRIMDGEEGSMDPAQPHRPTSNEPPPTTPDQAEGTVPTESEPPAPSDPPSTHREALNQAPVAAGAEGFDAETPKSSEQTPTDTRDAAPAVARGRHEPEAEHQSVRRPEDQSSSASELLAPHALAYRNRYQARPERAPAFWFLSGIVGMAAVVAIVAGSWFFLSRSSEPSAATESSTTTVAAPGPSQVEANAVGQIRAVLDGLGLPGISIEERDGTIYLAGVVASEDDRAAAAGASQALAGTTTVDASGIVTGATEDEVRAAALLAVAAAGYDRINVSMSAGVATLTGVTPGEGSAGLVAAVAAVEGVNQVVDLTETSDRAVALDTELKRISAVTPLVFASGQTDLNALQERVLGSVVEIIQAYPGPQITIVGYTDASGSANANQRLSLIRAENVRAYMIAQGIPADRLAVEARGETSASGSEAVAGLERRIEFEVGYSTAVGAADGAFRIGIVAPSARDDLAFTQSIVDAAAVVAGERDSVAVHITDGTFVPEEAAAAIRAYAADGYDLVIAHGSQYGTSLIDIAGEFPDTAFAWGTAADTFDLPNVSAYEVASDQGGYVLGVVSALLTDSDVIGIVGPLEVGDAKLFVDGFQSGVLSANPGINVLATYTGSFSDVALAAEAATGHISAGADILTGTAQMVVGAVGVASDNSALWFGTQSNQTVLEPSLVVASQVYHWEVALRQIVDGIEQGVLGGRSYRIDLANGGIIIEYNPGFALPAGVRDTADSTIAGIISGTISTGT